MDEEGRFSILQLDYVIKSFSGEFWLHLAAAVLIKCQKGTHCFSTVESGTHIWHIGCIKVGYI